MALPRAHGMLPMAPTAAAGAEEGQGLFACRWQVNSSRKADDASCINTRPLL
jgi:hypothetical protein